MAQNSEENAYRQKEGNHEVESAKGVLRWVEIIGNKLPHPFWLFVWICLLIIVVSAVTAYFGVQATGLTGSLLVPYVVVLLIMWLVLLFVWVAFNLPIGVGEYIYL
jgi:p-aminobenzoyl-glutamate transporter AbgT